MSPDEIVFAYPSISLSDVHAAWYYFENRNKLTSEIRGQRVSGTSRNEAKPRLPYSTKAPPK